MLSGILGSQSRDMAIDLGTANTLIYIPGKGIVLNEPSVIALTNLEDEPEVFAVGNDAKSMVGRTPEKIRTIYPMRDGVIADFVAAEEMIKVFISRVHTKKPLGRPFILICVPSSATKVERRAVYEAGEAAGAREVMIIEEPVAAALGAGLPIFEPQGCMVVDIGGGTTDIAVLSLGGVIFSKSIRMAGYAMDDAIVNYIRRKHHVLIGESSAERIKIEAGSAISQSNGMQIEVHVKGRDLRRGMPTQISFGPSDIAEALAAPIDQIADGIQRVLEELPPELVSDISNRGIVLTGGGALLSQIDVELRCKLGVDCKISDDPRNCAVLGSGLALEQRVELKDLLMESF